jgi:peptide deformylase
MGDLKNERTHRGIQLLGEYTRRSSKSSLTAVGMAYPQLARASDRNIRALAVQMGMTDARKESRTDNVHTLINPTYQPLKSSGRVVRLEICFSTPGIGLQILRWQQIMLHIPGKRSRMLDDNDSWYVQHEGDHLDGTLNTDVARQQRRPLYYVPPEWKDPFFRGGFTPAWPTFPFSQYDAMKTGEFDLADYFRFL